MNTLKRIFTLLLVLAMLTAALCGCKGGKSGKAEKNELTVGIAQDLDDSLDPHKMTAAGTREILFNVFEGLVKPDENGNLIQGVMGFDRLHPAEKGYQIWAESIKAFADQHNIK